LLTRYCSVLVGSEHMKREFERQGATSVVVAPYFVQPPDGTARSRDRNRLAYVGRMTSVKGGELLIEACARLRTSSGEPIRIDWIGDGPERRSWERLSAARGVNGKFHGWLDHSDRDAIVGRSCALVVPSVWPEPFGLVGIEAARLGVPAVAFNIGGIADWLEDDVDGALCGVEGDFVESLERGIERARGNLADGGSWGQAAEQKAWRFGLESHLRTLNRVLASVAEGSH
jgi:glycosyltransferase involved in cell wall biosynthesis